MRLVAITGNYGMGKTLVMGMFGALGAHTINADEIVSGLLKEAGILDKIRTLLGDGVFDSGGGLLRRKVADIIFSDSTLRHAVEDILHPLVFREIGRLAQGKEGIVVVEAPVVFERGYEKRFEGTVLVYTDEEVALDRLEARGISRLGAIRRLRCQMPVKDKIQKADFVVDNSGTPEDTKARVETIYRELLRHEGHKVR